MDADLADEVPADFARVGGCEDKKDAVFMDDMNACNLWIYLQSLVKQCSFHLGCGRLGVGYCHWLAGYVCDSCLCRACFILLLQPFVLQETLLSEHPLVLLGSTSMI